jgi:ribosome production factor 1
MKNFDTRLGQRLGRMLAAIFPQNPDFRGRNVITFHNQRDFMFFRHHRYIFNEKLDRVSLQEIGPRMTLKLMSVQHGTFDPKFGNYEYMYHPRMQVSRKKFFI